MNLGVTRLVATTLALSAFAVAIIAGLSSGSPASQVLTTALVSMIVCNLIGLGIGAAAERIVAEHIAARCAGRPISIAQPGNGAQSTIAQKNDRRS